jgi:hypothetical protein
MQSARFSAALTTDLSHYSGTTRCGQFAVSTCTKASSFRVRPDVSLQRAIE